MAAALKPQDVLVALKLVGRSDGWTYASLASELHLSQSEAHEAVRRLAAARLFSPVTNRIVRRSLLEFLIHGVPYAFPAEVGAPTRGVPTAWSAAPLAGRIAHEEGGGAVWPSADGTVVGREVSPLYRSVPRAAKVDESLHQLLALVDALRVGRARERNLARVELERRLAA